MIALTVLGTLGYGAAPVAAAVRTEARFPVGPPAARQSAVVSRGMIELGRR